MPVDPERSAVIATGVRRREEHSDPVAMRGLDRVEITVVDLLRYEAQSPREPDGRMRIGEPAERGGDGTGATPLAHFLTGAGSCLLNQLVRCTIAEDLPLNFLGASVRGEFRREAGGGFQRIGCEVRASGSIDAEEADALLSRAERLCYIHQTLVGAVEMTTSLLVDGHEVARHVEGPAPTGISSAPQSPG